MRRAVLWDLDGTLIDSADYHFRAWVQILANEGRDLSRAEFDETFGWRNDRILRQLLGPSIGDGDIQRIATAKEELYRLLVREGGLSLLPGADHWTARLHGEGWLQAIASSAPRANLDGVLEVLGIGSRFQAMVSAEEVAHGKPDPDLFLAAADKLRVPPAQCVVVEDAPAGIEAAHRAGMAAVGVLTTHADLQADLVVPTLQDLPPDAFQSLP
jgi:beta-phosphoglucomutase family hydrolase